MKKILFSLATITALFTGAYAEDNPFKKSGVASNESSTNWREWIFSYDYFNFEPFNKDYSINSESAINCLLHKAKETNFTREDGLKSKILYLPFAKDSKGRVMSCKNDKNKELILVLGDYKITIDKATNNYIIILGSYNADGTFDLIHNFKAMALDSREQLHEDFIVGKGLNLGGLK